MSNVSILFDAIGYTHFSPLLAWTTSSTLERKASSTAQHNITKNTQSQSNVSSGTQVISGRHPLISVVVNADIVATALQDSEKSPNPMTRRAILFDPAETKPFFS